MDPIIVTIPAFAEGITTSVQLGSPESDPVSFTLDNSPVVIASAPVITIPEASDGLISGEEAADGVQVEIELPDGITDGDTVTVSVTQPDGSVLDINAMVP